MRDEILTYSTTRFLFRFTEVAGGSSGDKTTAAAVAADGSCTRAPIKGSRTPLKTALSDSRATR